MIDSDATDDVRTITIDRPERRNALPSSGLDELRTAVESATEPVLLLEGAGEAFCAGADLEEVESLADGEAARAFARRGQAVARTLATYDGAVVAGIDGAARGGGVELALACDVRVCTPRSAFAESGVAIGLFGAWGGTGRLPAIVGRGEAMDLALSARVIDAEEARRIGLVSRVVDDPSRVARAIADNDADAVGSVAELLRPEGVAADADGPGGRRDSSAQQRQERRERDAFAALVESGKPVRKG